MNTALERLALFIRDILVIDEQQIRIGRLNYSREDLESDIIGVDMLGQLRRISSLEDFNGTDEVLRLGHVWRGVATLDFYGTDAYQRAVTFSLMTRTQVALDLMKSLGINIMQPTGPTDLKLLTGQQYGERQQLEVTIEISEQIQISTLRIDTAQVVIVDDISKPNYPKV